MRYFVKRKYRPIIEVSKYRYINAEGEAGLAPKSGMAGDIATSSFANMAGLRGWVLYDVDPPPRGPRYWLVWFKESVVLYFIEWLTLDVLLERHYWKTSESWNFEKSCEYHDEVNRRKSLRKKRFYE